MARPWAKGVKLVLKKERGFTLVEVVIAIIVLSLVTVAVVRIYQSNLFGIIRSGHRTEAIYEVQELLEQEIAREIDDDIDPSAHGWQEETLEIRFGESVSVSVQGWTVSRESQKENPGVKTSGIVFIPNPNQENEGE